jgi:hypothetical protein
MVKKVVLKVRVDLTFNTENEFWAALAEAKKALALKQLTHSATTRDVVTHDIIDLNFEGVPRGA